MILVKSLYRRVEREKVKWKEEWEGRRKEGNTAVLHEMSTYGNDT